MSDNEYMSKEGYEKALKRLQELKDLRVEISKEIGIARGFGDISENAEYDAAKEKQAFNEERLIKLEHQLSRVSILEGDLPTDKALIGCTVTIEDMADGEEIEYKLVSALEADPDQDKISIESPVGQGLLAKEVGDIAEIPVPVGTLKYKILKIERR